MGFIALAGLIAEMGVVRPKMTAVVAIMAGLPGAAECLETCCSTR